MIRKLIVALVAMSSIMLWVYLCWLHKIQEPMIIYDGGVFERMTYILNCFSSVLIYSCFCQKSDSRKKRVMIAIWLSLSFMVCALLVNNYLRYLDWNAMFELENNFSHFFNLVKRDIIYNRGWGGFRYPVLFLSSFIGCMGINMWRKYDGGEKIFGLLEKISIWIWGEYEDDEEI